MGVTTYSSAQLRLRNFLRLRNLSFNRACKGMVEEMNVWSGRLSFGVSMLDTVIGIVGADVLVLPELLLGVDHSHVFKATLLYVLIMGCKVLEIALIRRDTFSRDVLRDGQTLVNARGSQTFRDTGCY